MVWLENIEFFAAKTSFEQAGGGATEVELPLIYTPRSNDSLRVLTKAYFDFIARRSLCALDEVVAQPDYLEMLCALAALADYTIDDGLTATLLAAKAFSLYTRHGTIDGMVQIFLEDDSDDKRWCLQSLEVIRRDKPGVAGVINALVAVARCPRKEQELVAQELGWREAVRLDPAFFSAHPENTAKVFQRDVFEDATLFYGNLPTLGKRPAPDDDVQNSTDGWFRLDTHPGLARIDPKPGGQWYRDVSPQLPARVLAYTRGVNLMELIPLGCTGHAVIAGGAIVHCIARSNNTFEYQRAFAASDVDIYLIGEWNAAQATQFSFNLYRTLATSCKLNHPYCTSNSVNFSVWDPEENYTPHLQANHFQVIFTTFPSVPELLFSFDLDVCAIALHGTRLLALPRAVRALRMGYNTGFPDSVRSPPSRICKYAFRGFSYLDVFDKTDFAQAQRLWTEVLLRTRTMDDFTLIQISSYHESDYVGGTQGQFALLSWLGNDVARDILNQHGVATDDQPYPVTEALRLFLQKTVLPGTNILHESTSNLQSLIRHGLYLSNPWDGQPFASVQDDAVFRTACYTQEGALTFRSLRIASAKYWNRITKKWSDAAYLTACPADENAPSQQVCAFFWRRQLPGGMGTVPI